MLMNKKELDNWLGKKYGNEELTIFERGINKLRSKTRVPGKYDYLNVEPSTEYLEVWDSVGCMVETIGIYRPKGKGGTRIYDVEGVYFN